VIKSRAVDDSGNVEAPGPGVGITIAAQSCPCSIWTANATPGSPSINDSASVNLGLKFKSDVAGTVTGVRFYKGSGNTGTHAGALWTTGGTLLGSVTFTSETASGWQQMNFASPITITANTVYVISYRAPVGHYAGDNSGLASAGVDNPPLHALQNGVSGGNGLYAYSTSTSPVFPNSTYMASNYWVDVLFTPSH
jgi:hypothetical protein